MWKADGGPKSSRCGALLITRSAMWPHTHISPMSSLLYTSPFPHSLSVSLVSLCLSFSLSDSLSPYLSGLSVCFSLLLSHAVSVKIKVFHCHMYIIRECSSVQWDSCDMATVWQKVSNKDTIARRENVSHTHYLTLSPSHCFCLRLSLSFSFTQSLTPTHYLSLLSMFTSPTSKWSVKIHATDVYKPCWEPSGVKQRFPHKESIG